MPNATATITALLVKDGKLSPVEIEPNNLQAIYRQMECDYFEIPVMLPGAKAGQTIGVYVDEEALLKPNPSVCAVLAPSITRGDYFPIYGRGLMLIGAKPNGDPRSLTDNEVKRFTLTPSNILDDTGA